MRRFALPRRTLKPILSGDSHLKKRDSGTRQSRTILWCFDSTLDMCANAYRAAAYFARREYPKAILDFSTAIQLDPKSSELHGAVDPLII